MTLDDFWHAGNIRARLQTFDVLVFVISLNSLATFENIAALKVYEDDDDLCRADAAAVAAGRPRPPPPRQDPDGDPRRLASPRGLR